MRIAVFLLASLCMAQAVQAEDNTPQREAALAKSPTMTEMEKWESDLHAKYKTVIYRGVDKQPITEAAFTDIVVKEKRAFNMESNSGEPGRIVVAFLTDAEEKATQLNRK